MELLQIILDAKPDVNISDKDGRTPLDVAQLEGFEEISQLLIDAGGVNSVEESEEDFYTEDGEVDLQHDLMRTHSMSILISPSQSPLLRVVGGGELDGLYKLQDEPHEGKNLYVSDNYCIRWCQEGWVIDEQVRSELLGAAVYIAETNSPAMDIGKNWMLYEGGDWIEAPDLSVQPALLHFDFDEADDDEEDLMSDDDGGSSKVFE